MDIPVPGRVLPDNVPEERVCRVCWNPYYGFYGPEGRCFACRKSKMGAPTGPWNSGKDRKERA